jgi:flagellar motor switch protein FliN
MAADDHSSSQETQQWLVRILSDQLSQVFDTMAGESPLIEALELNAAPVAEPETLYWEIPISIAPGGPIWLSVPEKTWNGLGTRVLVAAGLDGSDIQTNRDTFKEAVDQAFAGLARQMTGRIGKEVNATGGKLVPGPPPQLGWHQYEIVFSDNRPVVLAFGISVELAVRLQPNSQTGAAKTPATVSPAAVADATSAGGPSMTPEASRKLDLLLDVELPVSVSFGRAHLPLKQVMKLTTGSIVELNRTISEPVDIIVNNCVIARGEVVVVEGNFGVRINEVISRQERLRTVY